MRPNAATAKAIAAFAGRRVLVAGDLMLDRYWSGDVDRISPEAPVPIVRKVGAYGVPGGAANTACNVAALGARVTLFGVTGQDEAGKELCGMLAQRGIDCTHVSIAAGRPTTVKLRIVAHDQQIVRIDDEDTSPIDIGLSDAVVKRAARLMPRVDAVLVSDYAKGFTTAGVVKGIIDAAARHGKPVVVDPKGSDFERYRGATVLKPNRSELAVLTGLPARHHDETMHAARHLLSVAGPTAIVVTEGKDGMTLLRKDAPDEHFPSFAREVYDVTGAGDTALATLAVALAAGAALGDAVWLANLAAGLAVGESGTVAISHEKLSKAMAGLRRR
ncbi:MAG: D-glycero-beta-D-manno-heptose-7-phosphate kinase [Bryobacteraceae bacterium]|jgi:D-beta-D-heptose 7-phosphate kinase/D-beta-D-heptose 1-phosphate adenosyltransferase